MSRKPKPEQPEDDVDVLCGAGAVAQTQFERDAALDDEEWRVGIRDALENAGRDHVGDPRANPALGDAELARVGLCVPGQDSRRRRRSGGVLAACAHLASRRVRIDLRAPGLVPSSSRSSRFPTAIDRAPDRRPSAIACVTRSLPTWLAWASRIALSGVVTARPRHARHPQGQGRRSGWRAPSVPAVGCAWRSGA